MFVVWWNLMARVPHGDAGGVGNARRRAPTAGGMMKRGPSDSRNPQLARVNLD